MGDPERRRAEYMGDPERRRGISSYALILRDLGGEGDGRSYTMQLAPLLGGGGGATRKVAAAGGGVAPVTTALPGGGASSQSRGSANREAGMVDGFAASKKGDGGDGVTGDQAATERARLLQAQGGVVTQEAEPKKDHVDADGRDEREVLVPILLVPKSKKKRKAKNNDMWNKRQIVYAISLAVPLGLLIPSIPLLPTVCAQGLLLAFTSIWGLGSIGLPMALFGTSGFERGFSRYVARIIFMSFSLLVVFIIYRAASSLDGGPSSLPPSPSSGAPTTYGNIRGRWAIFQDAPGTQHALSIWWTFAYALVGVGVFVGQAYSCIMGFCTGSDEDESESSEEDEDLSTRDLLQRLLRNH